MKEYAYGESMIIKQSTGHPRSLKQLSSRYEPKVTSCEAFYTSMVFINQCLQKRRPIESKEQCSLLC